jgi:hypothetical protein
VPRHELDPEQPTLSCAIDQSHTIIVPDWELVELGGESVEQLADSSTTDARRDRDGWTQLPEFPPPARPLADTEGTHEWELIELTHEGADELDEED